MALKAKTFRTTDDVINALKHRVLQSDSALSESDIINKALRCFLGLNTELDCTTYSNEIAMIQARITNLVTLNNLKEV